MHEADLVGVHEAGIAHHVAAVWSSQWSARNRGRISLSKIRDDAVSRRVRANVAAGNTSSKCFEKTRVNGHQVFKAPMLGAFFHHQNLAVALDDGGFDFADLFVHQHFVGKVAIENLLADFGHAISGTGSQWHAASRVAASTFRRT